MSGLVGRDLVMTTQYAKEIVVAGCKVKLTIREAIAGQWAAQGTIYCGTGDNLKETSFTTETCPSGEEAERKALGEAGRLIGGHN
jgi:hypothetical protein